MKCVTCGENEAVNDFYGECEGCIIEFEREEESEKLGKAKDMDLPNGKQYQSDSKDSFYNFYPVESLSPEQRKHFKEIMRKEVRE